MLRCLFLASAVALIASPALADPYKDESGNRSYALGTAVTAITGAIRTEFPVGICHRQEAAVFGSTIARLGSSPRRQAVVRRSDWLIATEAE